MAYFGNHVGGSSSRVLRFPVNCWMDGNEKRFFCGAEIYFCEIERNDNLFCQTERNDCISAMAALLLCLLYQLFFQVIGIGNHFTIGNLLIACAVITKLADAQRAFCS